ncbi:MCP four helix bundle domain-containing protein, partial [Plesiomonas shigelloides]
HERQTYNNIKNEWQAYLGLHRQVMDMLNRGEVQQARHFFLTQGIPAYQKLNTQTAELMNINQAYAVQGRQIAEDVFSSAKLSIFIC